jgi:hypothetical protein
MAGAADQHLTREHSFVKSMYLDDSLSTLVKGYHYRVDGGSVSGVEAIENALFVFNGSVSSMIMDNSLLTVEGGSVKGLTAKNSRIAIRSGKDEWAGGGTTVVNQCIFNSCEVDMFDATIQGAFFKNCRVNLFNCEIQGGLIIDGHELYLHKGKIKGNLDIKRCRGEFGNIGMEGTILLKDSDIGMKDGKIQGIKGPCVVAEKSSFRADTTRFESLKDPGSITGKTSHIRLTDCYVNAVRGSTLIIENEQSSATLIRGRYAASSGDCISIKAGATGYFKLLSLISANRGSGIVLNDGSVAIVDAVKNIYGQSAAVYSGNGAMCYLVGCGSVSSGGGTVIALHGGWCVFRGGGELGAISDIVTGDGAFMALNLLNNRYGQD